MARAIKQYRFYSENDANHNQPFNISIENLVNGNIFDSPSCYPILQLGIQTLPGTKFYLNNSTTPILIGSTGIYELDLEGLSTITDLHFDGPSISSIDANENAYLIIDVITEDS